MPEFGYVILRKPGPETKIEYGGFTGGVNGSFLSAKSALQEAASICKQDDTIHLLTIYRGDEGDGRMQLTVDDSAEDFLARDLN